MATHPELRVGAGRVDITPEPGIQLAGDIGRPRPVKEIHNRLYARALVLESGANRACFIASDVTLMMRKWTERLRHEAADLLGTESAAVLPHASQSHSSPAVGNHMMADTFSRVPADLPWLRGGDDRYNEPFLKGALAAVEQARDALQPVTMKVVRGMDGRVSFNRRFVLRDGTGKTHGALCSPDILHCEGPTDPEVSMAVFEASNSDPVAVVLHHTCHPVHGYPFFYVCPDWPGLWAEAVSDLFGGNCMAMTVNGACGNIHHTNHLDPNYKRDVHAYVARLTETIERIRPGLEPADAVPLQWVDRTLKVPRRSLPPDEVNAARDLLDKHPEPMWNEDKTNIHWDWVYALATLDLAEQLTKTSTYDYEIQVIRHRLSCPVPSLPFPAHYYLHPQEPELTAPPREPLSSPAPL